MPKNGTSAPPARALSAGSRPMGFSVGEAHMKTVFLSLALVMGVVVAVGADHPIDATPCEIVKNPGAFSGKMVRVRGEVVTFFEIADIRAKCDSGMAMIALWYPTMVQDSNAPDFKLVKDKAFKDLEAALSERGGGIEVVSPAKTPADIHEVHVFATLVGRLDGPDKLVAKDEHGKTVTLSTFGFTPSMKYTTRLVLKSVVDVGVSK